MNEKLLLFQEKDNANNQRFKALVFAGLGVQKLLLFFGILFISSIGFGQGPAGVSGNLRLWLDASDPDPGNSPFAAGPVTEWNDKSTNGDDLTKPGNATSDPIYVLSEPAFNGMPVYDFGPGDILRHNVGDWTTDHTFFIVFQQQADTIPGAAVFSSGDDGTPGNEYERFEINVDTTGNNFVHHTTTATDTSEVFFGTEANAISAPVLYSFTRVGNTITCFNNGLQVSNMSVTSGGTFDEYVLNANREENIQNNCLIAEVIIYDVVLSPEEIAKINNYLACKYNLPIAIATPGGIDPCAAALWLKADVGVDYSSGSEVDEWVDQSSSGIIGTAAGTQEPTLDSLANNFNPAMNFDPSTLDAISLGAVAAGDGLTIASDTFSIYTVAMPDTVSYAPGVLFSDNLCATQAGYTISYDSITNRWKYFGGTTSNTDSLSVFAANAPVYSLLKVKRITQNYTASTQTGTQGSNSSSGTINYSSGGATERWIGKEFTCGSNNFDGQISEILVVRDNLSSQEDVQIQSYLGLKYGITIPPSLANYLASDGTTVLWNFMSYWNDIAGLGRDNRSTLNQRIAKAQDKSAIITMSTENNFVTSNLDASRVSLADSSYLIWGNNSGLASQPWTTTGAPTNYALLGTVWRVKETNTVGTVFLQIEVDNPNNDVPDFEGNLHLIHGASVASGVITPMSMSSPGVWTVPGGIDFNDGEIFTFAVENRLNIEFTSASASSGIEGPTAPNFPSVIASGIVNVPTTFIVRDNGNGSATGGGTDYTYIEDTIDVVAMTYTSTPLTIVPPTIVDDADIEGPEDIEFVFVVAGSVSVGDVDGNNSTYNIHTYTITDNDSYNISIGSPVNGAEPSTPASFVISVDGGPNGSGGPINGTYTWTGSTAIAGTDFTIPADFSIPDGSSSVTVTIPIQDDGLLEGTETIVCNITATTPAIGVSTSSAIANITDDELANIPITISSNGDVLEGVSLQYTVSINGGATFNNSSGPVSGTLTYSGLAQNTVDFAGPATFSIPVGQSSAPVIVPTIGDFLVENTESVIVDISGVTIAGVSNSSTSSATGNIIDEDTTNLTMSISEVSSVVVEGPAVNAEYEVLLSGNKINGTGSDITGTLALSGGATFPDDYSPNIMSFSIPDGSGVGTVLVPLVNDALSEPNETLIATISAPSVGSINPAGNSATVTIIDDEANNTFISIGTPVDGVEGTSDVSFNVFIASGGPSAGAITGSIDYAAGSAQPGSDFTAVTTFSIPPGDTVVTITLPLVDDAITEPVETVVANLTGTPSVGLYANTISTATIADDDAANLEIFLDTLMSGAEGGSNVGFVVSLDLGTTNGTGSDIYGTVAFTGSAVSGQDYAQGTTASFTILPNESSDTIYLTVIDDITLELTDTVTGTIISTSVGAPAPIGSSAEAYILDNDLGSLVLSIQTPTNGEEGVNNASFVVAVDNGFINELGGPIQGNVTFSGDATLGADFSQNGTFSIPTGASLAPLTLVVTDDQSLELTESVIATISNPNYGGVNPVTNTDTLYIIDNDLDSATIVITQITQGVELVPTPTSAQFRVGINGGQINETGTTITGTIAYSGTAIEGIDYLPAPTIFTIPNNVGGDTITFQVLDDLLVESTETIIGTITSATLIAIDPIDTDTAFILDNDTDADNDGLADLFDPIVGNIDSDCDGIFDGCDADPYGDSTLIYSDIDGDGIKDECDADTNNDGTIDNGPDVNNDGLNDVSWDPTDNDQDLLSAQVDPDDNDPDFDDDLIPDGADADVDGDGIIDNGCDGDNDGIHDIADSDEGNDLVTDPGNIDANGNGIDDAWDVGLDDEELINYIVSPNGDGINETLDIVGLAFVNSHQLTIFNRYGVLIYQTDEYQGDWAGQTKDAINIGSEPLTDGTYYYVLEVVTNDNKNRTIRGFIDLRR